MKMITHILVLSLLQLIRIGAQTDECHFFRSISGSRRFQDSCTPANAVNLVNSVAKVGGCFRPNDSQNKAVGNDTTSILTFHTWQRCIEVEACWTLDIAVKTSLIMKAFMVTQNLQKSRYIFWVPTEDYEIFVKRKHELGFILAMEPYVTVKPFNYIKEIKETPLANSDQLQNISNMYTFPGFITSSESNIVRLVILHNYGGVWIDDDAVPLIDMYNIFAGVGLQTISAWSSDNHYNNHVLFLHKKSRLAKRRLEHLLTLPFDKPYLWPTAVQRNCKFGGGSRPDNWVHNDGISLLTHITQVEKYPTLGSPSPMPGNVEDESQITNYDDIEMTYPIGWFDPWWACDQPSSIEILCREFFIFHRLTKYRRMDKATLNLSFLVQLIESLYTSYDLEPMMLKDYIDCTTRDSNQSQTSLKKKHFVENKKRMLGKRENIGDEHKIPIHTP